MSWKTIQLMQDAGASWGDTLKVLGANKRRKEARNEAKRTGEIRGRYLKDLGAIKPREEAIDPETGQTYTPEKAGAYYDQQSKAVSGMLPYIKEKKGVKAKPKRESKTPREKWKKNYYDAVKLYDKANEYEPLFEEKKSEFEYWQKQGEQKGYIKKRPPKKKFSEGITDITKQGLPKGNININKIENVKTW